MNSGKTMKLISSARVIACILLLATSAFADDPKAAVSLFNGKDLTGWKSVGNLTNIWVVGKAALDPDHPTKIIMVGPGDELIDPDRGVNLVSEAKFGDCHVELEFMVGHSTPKSSLDSNSGIKLEEIYEIQMFDNYGKPVLNALDCGAVYSETPPLLNACKKPGEWQKLVIDFQAPRFDADGKKTANAKFIKVILNGQVVQDNVEIAHGTHVAKNAPEHPTGAIYLQGDHGSVAFRNITVRPLN